MRSLFALAALLMLALAVARPADAQTPPFSVTLLGMDATTGVFKRDFAGGHVDEVLQLSGTSVPDAGTGVVIELSAPWAIAVSPQKAELALYDSTPATDAGVLWGPPVAVARFALKPGDSHAVRLQGTLPPSSTQLADLRIDAGGQSRTVRLELHAAPWPLGLHATDIAPDPVDVWPFTAASPSSCVVVDRVPPLAESARIALGAPAQPTPGSHRLTCKQVELKSPGTCDPQSVTLRFDPLPAGRYEAVLDVEGEKLNVTLVVRHHGILAALTVLVGVFITVLVRSKLRRQQLIRENQEKIDDETRALTRMPSTWDLVQAHNALNRARGSIAVRFGIDDVQAALRDVKRAERPAVATINAALERLWLPASVLRDLKRELGDALALSSRLDEDTIVQRLTELSDGAADGFRTRIAEWLAPLDARLKATRDKVAQGPLSPTDKSCAETAFTVLQWLLADATSLNAKGERFRREHVAVLESVEPSLSQLEAWNGSTTLVADIVHCGVPGAVLAPEPRPSVGQTSITLDRDATIAAGKKPNSVRLLEEVTFTVPETPAGSLPGVRYCWTISDEKQPIVGGPRLTYLLGARPLNKDVTVSVELRSGPSQKPIATAKPLTVSVEPARWSESRKARAWQLSWELFASAIFGTLAAAVAVATYWTGKAFGDLVDYVTLLTAGAGVDFSVGAVRKLITDALDKDKKEI